MHNAVPNHLFAALYDLPHNVPSLPFAQRSIPPYHPQVSLAILHHQIDMGGSGHNLIQFDNIGMIK